MPLKGDSKSHEDTKAETEMGNTLTSRIQNASIDVIDNEKTDNHIGEDKEQVCQAKSSKKMMENTLH